ncbi:hypothetical protein ABZ832_09100 [Streptantibioticus parmotrematis]|uniref:hypothetical protein n=1 Tax=Streptantibioticus parmotrematis TaxID=2873249 RepID=UPI0034101E23
MPAERKKILLRLDPAVHDALARWAGDELRSTNAQIEFLLRRALADAGRMPSAAAGIPRRGRPTKTAAPPEEPAAAESDTAPEDDTPPDVLP